jgi:hypothetical protein
MNSFPRRVDYLQLDMEIEDSKKQLVQRRLHAARVQHVGCRDVLQLGTEIKGLLGHHHPSIAYEPEEIDISTELGYSSHS